MLQTDFVFLLLFSLSSLPIYLFYPIYLLSTSFSTPVLSLCVVLFSLFLTVHAFCFFLHDCFLSFSFLFCCLTRFVMFLCASFFLSLSRSLLRWVRWAGYQWWLLSQWCTTSLFSDPPTPSPPCPEPRSAIRYLCIHTH